MHTSLKNLSKPILNSLVILVICLGLSREDAMAQITNSNQDSFTFFLMSDPQFGMYTGNKGFSKETKNFERAIADANRLKPAFIVVCGDLVNQSTNKQQIAEYKRIAAQTDENIPIYNVPGNHDVENQPTKKTLRHYRKNFGRDYYSFQYGNLYGIVINSMLISNPAAVPKESKKQYSWLVSELKKANRLKYTNIVLFQHIPFFINNENEKDQYFNIPIKIRKKYLKVLHKYGVEYVFAGHLHYNAIGKGDDIKMIITSALGMPLAKDSSGFRIVRVRGSKMDYPYYPLDSVPNRRGLLK